MSIWPKVVSHHFFLTPSSASRLSRRLVQRLTSDSLGLECTDLFSLADVSKLSSINVTKRAHLWELNENRNNACTYINTSTLHIGWHFHFRLARELSCKLHSCWTFFWATVSWHTSVCSDPVMLSHRHRAGRPWLCFSQSHYTDTDATITERAPGTRSNPQQLDQETHALPTELLRPPPPPISLTNLTKSFTDIKKDFKSRTTPK